MEQNHIILVVNENAEKRAVFRKRLEQKAMVLESGNEDAAIKLLGAVKISLVFLIPGQGEEESFLLRRMKEQGLVERIPVMVCDNSYDQERMNRFYAWGCSDYVCEPLSDLVLSLANWRRFTISLYFYIIFPQLSSSLLPSFWVLFKQITLFFFFFLLHTVRLSGS